MNNEYKYCLPQNAGLSTWNGTGWSNSFQWYPCKLGSSDSCSTIDEVRTIEITLLRAILVKRCKVAVISRYSNGKCFMFVTGRATL